MLTLDEARTVLHRLGFSHAEPLASGAEGAVFRVTRGRVAKVWARRSVKDVERSKAFYDELCAASLPFATPSIEQVMLGGTYAVSLEVELSGEPLQRLVAHQARRIETKVVSAFVEVLANLARAPVGPAARELAALQEARSFRQDGDTFARALDALIERRVSPRAERWRRRLENFDEVRSDVRRGLAFLDAASESVLHGDVFGENVLVDADGRPSAVLDFGFVTTVGDPRFDAAVCAAIVNLYGPHASAIREQLTGAFAGEFGFDADTLRLYQAAYALVTADFFDEGGRDGHTAWSLGLLRDREVRRALQRR